MQLWCGRRLPPTRRTCTHTDGDCRRKTLHAGTCHNDRCKQSVECRHLRSQRREHSRAISGSQLSFNPKLYYPLGGKRVIFYSYYPRTTATSGSNYITAPGNGVAPAYHFTLTGAEDIMYAAGTPTGSTSTMPVSLTFNHVLTQLQLNTSLLGALSSIKLLGVYNKGTLDIGNGNVTYDSSTTDITLTVPLLGSVTNTVMVPAGVASYKVEVVLLLSLLKRTYLVKPTSGNFQPGVIYTISL